MVGGNVATTSSYEPIAKYLAKKCLGEIVSKKLQILIFTISSSSSPLNQIIGHDPSLPKSLTILMSDLPLLSLPCHFTLFALPPPFLLILHCQVPFSCGSPKTRLEGAPTPQSPGPPVAGIILSNCRGPQPPTHNQPFVLFSVLTAIGTFLTPFTIKFTQPDIEKAGQE